MRIKRVFAIVSSVAVLASVAVLPTAFGRTDGRPPGSRRIPVLTAPPVPVNEGDVGTDDRDVSTRDQVILDDLIVDGSACIGFDCVNGESFGFDTIRIKENNLRIRAMDTSSTASFPTNDWQITFNDSSNGGQNKFSIDDIDGGRTPFTIEAGAPSHSLYVDDGGRLGLGTNTPVVDVHIKSGNTPTTRLEQDGSNGFTPQTWDLAGNEANFLIRDATNGSTLPFRIFPGASSNSLTVAGDDDVGIGLQTAESSLHVKRTDGTAQLYIEGDGSTTAVRALMKLENNGGPKITLEDTSTSTVWEFAMAANGNFEIDLAGSSNLNELVITDTGRIILLQEPGAGADAFILESNGDLEIAGPLTENSDVNGKTAFQVLGPQTVLDRVVAMNIAEWEYKNRPGVRHVGPTAQDFHAAFGLGYTDAGIATLDTSGVALVSIQALADLVAQQAELIDALEARVTDLEEQLSD